jgi:putative transposase
MISCILQSLTVAHTWHYHRRYLISSHVARPVKSPIIQDDDHLLTVTLAKFGAGLGVTP